MAIGPLYNSTWLSAKQLPPIVTFGFVYLVLIGDRRSAEIWDPKEF
ncbi:MAG TPA: hypothetical protein VH481_09040 [Nitrososphaeraceae archaeon]|jgi:hypothetical protein